MSKVRASKVQTGSVDPDACCFSLHDIDLWFTVVLGSKPWLKEYNLVPIPWEIPIAPHWSGSNGQRIRIGVMWHDDVVLPQPPIRRALKTLVDVLKQDQAFEIVDYKPFKHFEAGELAVSGLPPCFPPLAHHLPFTA